MPNLKLYDYNRTAMVVVNFEDHLQPNTLEFTLHHLKEQHIDLSGFYDKYSNDGSGRAAIDAYTPDNQFRSRDPRVKRQKEKYGKRHQAHTRDIGKVLPAGEFYFDLKDKTCACPTGKNMWLVRDYRVNRDRRKLFFEES